MPFLLTEYVLYIKEPQHPPALALIIVSIPTMHNIWCFLSCIFTT